MRGLIRPPEGWGLAYIDFSSQEIGIAAALSGDERMIAGYVAGDPYLAFAKDAKLVPLEATKATHKTLRDRCKAIVLGINYGMGADAMAVLQSHDWPGNIRQLRNNVERVMILALGDPNAEISASMLPAEVGALVPAVPSGIGGEKLLSLPLREAREAFERDYLVAQISRFGGNISRTAEFIGMERSALHRKLKSLGIE